MHGSDEGGIGGDGNIDCRDGKRGCGNNDGRDGESCVGDSIECKCC